MAYDLQEQEQIAAAKAWWSKYGRLVTWALIIVLVAYTAWTLWGNHQRKQLYQASQLFYEMQNAVVADNKERVGRIAADIQAKFGKTPYASMAGLIAARAAYEAKEAEAAKSQLRWIVHSGRDEGYKAIARIRLAAILLEEEKFEEALGALAADFPPAFASMAEDRRGDIYYAQGRLDEARRAFRLALERAAPDDQGRVLIQLKLEDLGGEAAAPEK